MATLRQLLCGTTLAFWLSWAAALADGPASAEMPWGQEVDGLACQLVLLRPQVCQAVSAVAECQADGTCRSRNDGGAGHAFGGPPGPRVENVGPAAAGDRLVALVAATDCYGPVLQSKRRQRRGVVLRVERVGHTTSQSKSSTSPRARMSPPIFKSRPRTPGIFALAAAAAQDEALADGVNVERLVGEQRCQRSSRSASPAG